MPDEHEGTIGLGETDPADDFGDFPEQDDYVEPKKVITVRGVAIVGARVATGLVGIGVAVATVAAATFLPLPTVGAEPTGQTVIPVPTAQQLVCPGAVLRLADDTGQGATTASAIGRAVVRSFSSSGSVDSNPLAQSDASTGGTSAAPSVISTPPNQADPTEQILLSGAQSQQADEGDFVGLAAADCAVPSGDSWLVGGSTSVGRTTLLTLSNPTEVPATVNLELFGGNGRIAAPGTSGIIVAPNGQRVLSLAGFQPDVATPVVHVTSTGGQVVASLQQSTVRGLDPGGLDILGAGVSPALENVIPGLRVDGLLATQELQGGGAGFEDLRTVLRLFAPGEGTVTATVSVVPEDGVSTGVSFELEIDAGRVTDTMIGELEDGNYTVRVESSVPMVAGVRVSSALATATDFAWLASSSLLTERAQLTVAPGPAPRLHLTNLTQGEANVTVLSADGTETSVVVSAGASTVVDVEGGLSYELRDFDELYAAVSYAGEGMIARYSVHPPGVGSSPLVIYP